MKLSAQIVFDNLPQSFGARLLSEPVAGMALLRPELLESGMRSLRGDHLYVVSEERLPQRISIDARAVLVCIGPGRRTRYFSERCCVIQVPDTDFYRVFNAIQHIYDRHDAWSTVIGEIINDDANIDAVLECSAEIFDNPLTVIDSQFRYLGQWGREETSDQASLLALGTSSILDPHDFSRYIANRDLSMDVAEPFVLELLDSRTLNANLIDAGEYYGCLTVYQERRDFRPSDSQLASYLARMLVRAVKRRSRMPGVDSTSLRRIVMDLVNEVPLDGRERAVLEAQTSKRAYACIRIRLNHRMSQLPIGYVCTLVESAFPAAIAFEHHRTSVVAFVAVEELADESGTYLPQILEHLAPLLSSLEAKAAVSDVLSDLAHARLYFLQASATLENGSLIHPEKSIYVYQDYALTGIIVNALGDMPVEMLFSDGFRRLIEHDRASSTSYVETLRALLDNNMSVTKTARALYVHRSTLIERLARMRRILDEDLDDPDVRLHLQLVLKALAIRNALSKGNTSA